MEQIFFEIRDAVLAKVKEIKWVDLDEGQLENFDNPPVDYPCLLVGFPLANYSNSSDMQAADLTITIKLAFKIWEKFNAAVPLANQPTAFDHFKTIRKVASVLHGLPGENRSELMRVRMNKNSSPDPKIYEINFECEYFDDTTMVEYASIPKPSVQIMQN